MSCVVGANPNKYYSNLSSPGTNSFFANLFVIGMSFVNSVAAVDNVACDFEFEWFLPPISKNFKSLISVLSSYANKSLCSSTSISYLGFNGICSGAGIKIDIY